MTTTYWPNAVDADEHPISAYLTVLNEDGSPFLRPVKAFNQAEGWIDVYPTLRSTPVERVSGSFKLDVTPDAPAWVMEWLATPPDQREHYTRADLENA